MGAKISKLNAKSMLENRNEIDVEKLNVFHTQDPATGDFDIVFDFDGKKLYAHKIILASVSDTFSAMLSERWTKSDEPIPIKDFSYADFKEFISFIYFGECSFTVNNIYIMVDIAEFYNVKTFKEACEAFLFETKLNYLNAFEILEFAYRYSMENLKKNVLGYISKDFSFYLNSQQFQDLPIFLIKDILQLKKDYVIQEQVFEMLYKWAENRALKKQEYDKDLNLNEAIKEELKEFLPLVKFYLRNFEFLIKFVVSKSFLFTGPELSDLLWSARYTVCIIDENGKTMKGVLDCPDLNEIYDIIQLKKHIKTTNYWETSQPRPSKPTKLIKKKQIEYYLVFDHENNLRVKHQQTCDVYDYILAEMTAEDGFKLGNIKII